MSLSALPTIHPTLFNAIFNPNSTPNSLTTPKFEYKAHDASGNQPQSHYSFSNGSMNLYAYHETASQNPLILDAPHASLESDNFCYVGQIQNGTRHNTKDENALMIAKCDRTVEVDVDATRPLIAKYVCHFENGLMNDTDARVEWYQLPEGVTWEGHLVPWWQENMRIFPGAASDSDSESDADIPSPSTTALLSIKLTSYLTIHLGATLAATYSGGLRNGLKHGTGAKMKWVQSGQRYEGDFFNGKRHGQGTMEWPNNAERYEGAWHEGLPHGEGALYFFNVQVGSCNFYEGSFKNGARDGKGVFFYSDGTKFDGEWHNDQKNGWGEFEFTNGVRERGFYENDVKVRDGVIGGGASGDALSTGAGSDAETCPSSRSSSPGTPKSPRPASRSHSTSGVSRTGSTARKRALSSRKSSRLKNRRAAKDLQVANNQQFDNIPFYIDDLLMHTDYEQWEIPALWSVLTRYAPRLQAIYNYYSLFGANEERIRITDPSDAQSVKKLHVKVSKHNDLSLHQFWRFARDCGLVSFQKLSLAAIDRIFMKTSQISTRPDIHNVFEGSAPKLSILLKTANTSGNIHSPQNKIRFREFCEALFRIAYAMHHSYDRKQHVPLNERFQKTLEEIVLPEFERVEQQQQEQQLFLRNDPRFAPLVQEYEKQLLQVFRDHATLQSHNIRDSNLYQENDATITVRQFLRLLDTKNFVGPTLTLMNVMNLLDAQETVSSAVPVLVDRELIFEEFVECLLKCALKKYAKVEEWSEERRVAKAFGVMFGGEEDVVVEGEETEGEEVNGEDAVDEQGGEDSPLDEEERFASFQSQEYPLHRPAEHLPTPYFLLTQPNPVFYTSLYTMTHLQILTCSFYTREEDRILSASPSLSSLSFRAAVTRNFDSGFLSNLRGLIGTISPDCTQQCKKYTCPITKCLIVYPVRFEGKLYEREAFMEHSGMREHEEPRISVHEEDMDADDAELNDDDDGTESMTLVPPVDSSLLVPLWKFRLKMALKVYKKLKKLVSEKERIKSRIYHSHAEKWHHNHATQSSAPSATKKRPSPVQQQTRTTQWNDDATTRRVMVNPVLSSITSDDSLPMLENITTPKHHSNQPYYTFTPTPILSFPPIYSSPNYRDHTKILFFIRELIFFTGHLTYKSLVQCREMQQCYELYQYASALKTALLGSSHRQSLSYECNEDIRRRAQLRLGLVGSVRALCQPESNPNLLVSGSQEGQIDVWDLKEEKIVHTLTGHRKRIQSLTEMSDGRIISGSFDSELKVWDIVNGECVKTMRGHTDQVSCVLALQGGKFFASCCSSCTNMDTTIRIWSYPECKEVMCLEGHYKGVSQLIQLRDGHLASCSPDKTIRIWNLQSGTCVKVLRKHAKAILRIVELHDGTLCAASQDGKLKIWDIHTGCCVKTFQAHKEPITSLIQLRDRTVATSSWDRTIRFWDIRTGRHYTSVFNDGDCAYCLLEQSDGTLVAGSYERIQCYL